MTKKTIGILTHYQVHNHGAILQLYGLYHALEKLGLSPCVLTYQKNFDFIAPELKNKYTLSVKSIPFYLHYLYQQGLRKTWFNFKKNQTLARFKKRHFVFAPLDGTTLDYAVVGSDEVFSLEAGINRMMYGYGVNSRQIFSYAASFGQTDISDIEQKGCRDVIANGLKHFSHICVRDEASSHTVKELIGTNPAIHFDPVLLYGFEKELQTTSVRLPQGRYLLVYAYDTHLNNPAEITPIRDYARKNGLTIVSPGFYHSWADMNINVNPLELLQFFKQAEGVVTDTFHGSVLSILTNRPFAAFVRDMNANKMNFLLKSLGITTAKMQTWDKLPFILTQPIEWAKINNQIQQERLLAVSYLQHTLS